VSTEESNRPDYKVVPVAWESADAEHARSIRMNVFVEEQKVPAAMELDEIDPVAYHVVAFSDSGQPCGTGRLFADEADPTTAHIGRMAVMQPNRKSGCGGTILASLIEEARRRGFRRVVLSAQTHALGFYESHGFITFGEEYLDADIPHRAMELHLS